MHSARSTAHTAFTDGISVYYKNQRGEVFHTYSCYSRGIEMLNGAYYYLDPMPNAQRPR